MQKQKNRNKNFRLNQIIKINIKSKKYFQNFNLKKYKIDIFL